MTPYTQDSIDTLPAKQREVLESLVDYIREYNYAPSIQQLCERCGVSSTSTIHYHLTALKKKGFIAGNPAEKRALTVRADLLEGGSNDVYAEETEGLQVPVMGTIAAGQPLQTTDGLDHLDFGDNICPPGCYALRVRGYSMIEDHIMDGDVVIVNPKSSVRDGDVVVALVDGESATLKRIYREKDAVRLQPANAEMEPIYAKDVQVQGKVQSILRTLH